MANGWQSGLDDSDDLSQYPNAANPLTALGIDPDEARANPRLLDSLNAQAKPGWDMTWNATQKPPDQSAPTPAAPAVPTLASQGQEGVTGELRTAKSEEDAASKLGTVDPSILAAQKARDEAADKAQSFNDASYRPSIGERIWRGVRGGLTGLANKKGLIPGILSPGSVGATPYGAPNDAGQAEQGKLMEAQRTTGRTYDEALENWKRAQEARKEGLGATKDAATAYGGAAGHAAGLMTSENKSESENEKSAAKLKLSQDEFDQRSKRLQTDPELSKLSPINRALYLANGKIPDPQRPTEGELTAQEIARGMVIFKNQHGGKGPQSLEEFNSVISAAKGELGRGDTKADAIAAGNLRTAARLTQQVLKGYEADLKDAAPNSPEATEIQARIDAAQKEYDDLSSQLTGLPTSARTAPSDMTQVPGAIAGTPAPLTVQPPTPEELVGAGMISPKAARAATAQPNTPAVPPGGPIAQPPKPQPAPEGTRKQTVDGRIQVKRGGKWVDE